MSTTDIMLASFDRLLEFVYDPQPEIVFPGHKEDPPSKGMWLEPGFFPNEPANVAWDNDSCIDTRGFFQILLYYRPGQGQIEPSELADALIAHFPKGLSLGPVRVRKRAWQSPSITHEDRSKLYIPVTVPYKGLT